MKTTTPNKIAFLALLGFLVTAPQILLAQVGINTNNPATSAALEIRSTNKGFLMTRVALTATTDVTTIKPGPTTGLIVYNTNTSIVSPTQVTPGFYYFNGSVWKRFYTQGYTLNYNQTNQVTASTTNTTYTILPGLDTGNITVPFSGTYQIRIEGYYSAGDLISTNSDGGCQGSISLGLSTNSGAFTTLKETYITSSSKRIGATGFGGSTVNNLSGNASIVYNIELYQGTNYRFTVRGREWLANNVSTGVFGRNTNGYSGANGTNDAQRGSMIISLVKQQ